MIVIRALLHHHVNHATQRTTMFGLNSRVLDLHFIDEIKRNRRTGVAADQVCRLLALHEVGVLRVRSAGYRETVIASVGSAARSGTAGPVAWIPSESGIAH